MTAHPIKVAHVSTIDATLRFLMFNQLQALRRAGYDVAGVSAPGPWTAELAASGIRHHPIRHLTRRWHPLADVRAFIELVALFRRERFTIVHAHMPKTGVLGRLAARIAGVPIIVNTVHGLYGMDPGPLVRTVLLFLERLAARFSHFELSQSRENLALLTELGVLTPSRSMHLGNGVDLQHFNPDAVSSFERERLRVSLGLPQASLVVGTVGRLVHDKGYREFIAAASRICARRQDVAFIAVGPRDLAKRDALSEQEVRRAEDIGIKFLGMRMDMRELYSLMDIFVLASYREGFPRSAIEAAAMRTPLVLTDIRGCREVVTDGVDGLLVPPGKVEPLVDALLRLIDDADLRRRLGSASRRRALEEFDERAVHARVLRVYEQLLEERTIDDDTEHLVGAESAAPR